jgi:antitoxin (DNA-binding transcriptional repressor) of toxin-antitoxin stability system
VQSGEDITVTVNGRPVAHLSAVRPQRRRWLTNYFAPKKAAGIVALTCRDVGAPSA